MIQLLSNTFIVKSRKKDFFKWFSDFSNYPLIFEHVISIVPITGSPEAKLSKQYKETVYNFIGKKETLHVEVVKYEESKEIWVAIENPRLLQLFTFEFEENSDGTTSFYWKLFTRHTNPVYVYFLKIGTHLLFKKRLLKANKRLTELFP